MSILLRRSAPLWLLVLAWLAWQSWPQINLILKGEERDSPAPHFQAVDLSGQRLDSAQWQGQVVLVNVWATWCPPCRRELPALEAVYRRHRQQGLQVVAITTDNAPEREVAAIARQLGLTFPVVPARGDLARRFGANRVVPTSLLLDRRGRIVARIEGLLHEPQLEARLEPLLTTKP